MPQDHRKRDAAIGIGGAGVLAGTASLGRIEGKVQQSQKARFDRKITRLQAQMPTKGTPVAYRPHLQGQFMARKPGDKATKKAKVKALSGEINQLRAAKNKVKKPHLAGNAKATWAGIAVGAPALWHGARSQVQKKDSGYRRHDVDAGVLGAAAGAGAYQEASYALKPFDRRAERKIAQSSTLNRQQKDYQSKMRPKNAKAGDPAWRPYFRNYPKNLPGSRLKRTLAVTHTGKTGGAATVAAGLAGGAGAAHLSRKHREKNAVAKNNPFGVSKAYQYNPDAKKKDKSAYVGGAAASIGASAVGGHAMGWKVGEGIDRGHSLKGSLKYMARSKHGRIGMGLGAAGIRGAHLSAQHAKKTGVLRDYKKETRQREKLGKSYSMSAFGVDHG